MLNKIGCFPLRMALALAAQCRREYVNLNHRALAFGEAALQALLLPKRQTTAAINNALEAQLLALKAYYGLLVAAHLIWELDHD